MRVYFIGKVLSKKVCVCTKGIKKSLCPLVHSSKKDVTRCRFPPARILINCAWSLKAGSMFE